MTAFTRPDWSLADCPGLDRLPPTSADLPDDDDEEMMPSKLHLLQIVLLMETLRLWMAGRRACFIGGDMFVYFSPTQRRDRFRGPDFFVVLDVPDYPRRNWVIWQEGGRSPDVVVELLSTSTARVDRRTKKNIYQDILRVPEYYWFDPETAEFRGFHLVDGVYEELSRNATDRMPCVTLGLMLVIWEGECFGYRNRWLRWATPDGELLPTPDEVSAAERGRTREAEAQLEEYRRRFGDLPS